MYEHFSQKFPARFAAIDVLARVSPALRSALADYEELSTWLAAEDSTVARDPQELERARKMAQQLEQEILRHLSHLETQDEHST